MIPQNITKQHLEKAISEISKANIPPHRGGVHYSISANGKTLPIKYIISVANKFANGIELEPHNFDAVEAKKFLTKNDYKVIDKRLNDIISYFVLGAAWNETEDQTERFIRNGIWENGYYDKFLEIVRGVKVGDKVAIKSSFATRDGKSMLRVKATGTVLENVGDGRTLKINWDKPFSHFDLEGYGGYRNTIQEVSEKDIEAIFRIKNNTMGYFTELNKFLVQSKTGELGTSDYKSHYQDLTVKVSFGKGNQARVPWIAFLNPIDTVQDGIYPVYLYYKEKDLLILAYGVSETNKPNRNWSIAGAETIEKYFTDHSLGKPERYGSSFVFRTYNTTKPLSEMEIEIDLSGIISTYYDTLATSPKSNQPFDYRVFQRATSEAGIFVADKISIRFISSLLTKPFVILTGLSGSGKTKLAQAFAMWICNSESQYCIVPVGADWTNREPLVGFPNALVANDYKTDEYGVLKLMIEATKDPDKPYFLILDEMNLSHVERYFADFLSIMESKTKLSLHSGTQAWNGIPSKIGFPENLFIIGTVNIDETTYMFSPKVLDRASVIEFRVTLGEMEQYLQSNSSVSLKNLESVGAFTASGFVKIATEKNLKTTNTSQLNESLIQFFFELKKIGAEFGFRSASEILRYVAVVNKIAPEMTTAEIIDSAILQKLLPKVHGSRKKLEPVLRTLGTLCLHQDQKFDDIVSTKIALDYTDGSKIKYPDSLEKILRMYYNLLANGFTSYAEA